MLALSPNLFTNNIGYWPLEDAIGHEDHNYFYRDNVEPANSPAQSIFLNFPAPLSSDQLLQVNQIDCPANPSTTTAISGDLGMAVKKLNHNASERDRRKKINHLYSSLRRLLPASDHTKKLSIPATISRVLKYIPELQQEVEGLVRKKEELWSRINSRKQLGNNIQVKQEINCNQMKSTSRAISLPSASASQLNDKEIALQISTYNVDQNPLSEFLHSLEEDGLLVINASSFESFGGRLFHNLHLQMEDSNSIECGSLGEKLMCFCDNKEALLL